MAVWPPIRSIARSKAMRSGGVSMTAAVGSSGPMCGINAHCEIQVNAHSDRCAPQNLRVQSGPKPGPASPFWNRLIEALSEYNARHKADAWELTQSGVARKLQGVHGERMSQGSVHRWYTGTGMPEIHRVIYLAKLTGVCVEWLLTSRGPKYPTPSAGDEYLEAVCSLALQLPDGERARLLEWLSFKVDLSTKGVPSLQEALENARQIADTGRHKKLPN
jgi:hypothetical protein